MSLWHDYLITQVCTVYCLSPTEQEVLLAKFPNEEKFRTDDEVGELSLKNDKLPSDTQTVAKHMRTIYKKKLRCPEKCEAFPGYKLWGQDRDPVFLEWIKPKYLEWKKNRNDPPPPPQSVNPFIPINGMIDNPQLFFDRSLEIGHIFETLNTGSCVAVIGKSAIGKSSLLMEICRQAPNKLRTPRQPIYLDLNGCIDETQVYSRFANKIGIEISNNDLYSSLQNYKLLLLALDNVECQGFTRSVRDCLRSLVEGSQSPLKLVIAATQFLDELFDDSQTGGTSPLAGSFQNEVLKPWNEAIIREFIDSRLKASWLKLVTNPVSFTEEEIALIIAESGGHPQKLMQLCYRTYAGYLEEIQ